MKKIFFTTILSLILCFCSFGLFGCGASDYSKDDLDSFYTAITTTNKTTSQFFDGDYLKVDFDSEKINISNSQDKSYIFTLAYQHYLKSSSNLLSSVIDRAGGRISYVVRNFSQKQLNTIYDKFSSVKDALYSLAESKKVFEISDGNLHYKNVIASYNSLINRLYDLNNTFANYYFGYSSTGADFSTDELTDANVRDMLNYQLLKISKVSFEYELLNFMFSNPLGETSTWYDSTTYLKNYVLLAKSTFTILNNSEDLASHIGSNKTKVLPIFENMQIQEKEFDHEYSNFNQSVNTFNVKAYFASTNKAAYISSCSTKEQSSYEIIRNFLTGRYSAYTTGLTEVLNYM